jgi:methyl-accepting chemotaxis protein
MTTSGIVVPDPPDMGTLIYQAGNGAFKVTTNLNLGMFINASAYARAGMFVKLGVLDLQYSAGFWLNAFLAVAGVMVVNETGNKAAEVNADGVREVLNGSAFNTTMEQFRTVANDLASQTAALENTATRQELAEERTRISSALNQSVSSSVNQAAATHAEASTQSSRVSGNCNQLITQASEAGAGLTQVVQNLNQVNATVAESAARLQTVTAAIRQNRAAVSFL